MIWKIVNGIQQWPSDADFFETSEIAATAPFPGKYDFLQPCHSASLIIICMPFDNQLGYAYLQHLIKYTFLQPHHIFATFSILF